MESLYVVIKSETDFTVAFGFCNLANSHLNIPTAPPAHYHAYHSAHYHAYELEGTSTGGVYDVINDYEIVAEVKRINKMEAPNSDDGDGFNLNKCAAYVPHHMKGIAMTTLHVYNLLCERAYKASLCKEYYRYGKHISNILYMQK